MTTRVFITGATGYLGSAIAARLARDERYEVHGLTRNKERGRALEAIGVQPVVGDLQASPEWMGVLKNCDAVVHLAFDPRNGASDRDAEALDAFRHAALDGRVRKVLYTSGIWVMGPSQGDVLDESAPLQPLELVSWRAAHEEIAIDLDTHEVETVILRPGMVYGEGRGILSSWWKEAHEKKTIHYPGGDQHWAMVHRDDVAEAYALALEHAHGGERYILADDTQATVKQLATAAAKASGAKAIAQTPKQITDKLGLFGKALLNDLQVTSAKARRELGWVPHHTSFAAAAAGAWAEYKATREAPVA